MNKEKLRKGTKVNTYICYSSSYTHIAYANTAVDDDDPKNIWKTMYDGEFRGISYLKK